MTWLLLSSKYNIWLGKSIWNLILPFPSLLRSKLKKFLCYNLIIFKCTTFTCLSRSFFEKIHVHTRHSCDLLNEVTYRQFFSSSFKLDAVNLQIQYLAWQLDSNFLGYSIWNWFTIYMSFQTGFSTYFLLAFSTFYENES